jgi:acyl dehydratase
VALDTAPVGKRYPPFKYEAGREKIRDYARAVGEDDPVHHDREAARSAGFRDLVAPPMFCVVYSAGAMAPALLDPELALDLGRLLHAGQEFVWGEPVCAGDEVETSVTLAQAYEKGSNAFYVFESTSTNQDRREVVRGAWTEIVRG